ncbi:MAG: histidinol-phosphatase HisJ [Deltaproteobacteria bacterium]|jgi:histidinol-phosphatase (PHP family)|nr:histidinol-phosphatase HisJ [Deltaproteobacteria bacterium]
MQIDVKSDYHMHTVYSDGNATIAEMVQSAIQKGMDQITFTDHMPLPWDNDYAMRIDNIEKYKQEIELTQKNNLGKIRINKGIEFEFLPAFVPWIQSILDKKWDYKILSVHNIYKNNQPLDVNGSAEDFSVLLKNFDHDIKAVCLEYYNIIQTAVQFGWFDIVGHLDVIKKHNFNQQYFDDSAPWYRSIVLETLDIIKKQGMKMEVNMSGFNDPVKEQHPSKWIIQEASKRNIPLVLSSDSHKSKSIGQNFNIIDGLLQK